MIYTYTKTHSELLKISFFLLETTHMKEITKKSRSMSESRRTFGTGKSRITEEQIFGVQIKDEVGHELHGDIYKSKC